VRPCDLHALSAPRVRSGGRAFPGTSLKAAWRRGGRLQRARHPSMLDHPLAPTRRLSGTSVSGVRLR